MRPKNQTIFYLSLIPAPWFCADFVPVWLMWALSAMACARIFTPLPSILLGPLCLGLGYMCFQEYDRRLIPESAVSFLSAMIAAKIFQKEKNFNTTVILGMLWGGSFALFNNTLYYLAYLGLFFLLSVNLLGKNPHEKFSFSSRRFTLAPLKSLAKTLPLIIALFLFFPRFRGFLPSANSAGRSGVVGYSKTIDNTNASNLKLSSKTAFYATTNRKLPQRDLYWRGRAHSSTDGYNWRPGSVPPENSLPLAEGLDSIKYSVKYEQDLEGDLPLLETPLRIVEGPRFYKNSGANTFAAYRKNKKNSLTAVSNLSGALRSSARSFEKTKKIYLELPDFLPKAFKDIADNIPGSSPEEVIQGLAATLQKKGFSYTLSPGPMPTLAKFIENKKGFCTHYASLMAILLRSRNIPARVVSGFQGGEYNQAGGFYTVRSNDAHAWVEYFEEQTWKRVDPTEFVSPERIAQGGEIFLNANANDAWSAMASSFLPLKNAMARFKELEQLASNLNYRLSLFFDNFDRDAQKRLARELNLELKSFYALGGLLALAGLGFVIWTLRINAASALPPEDREFRKFEKKLLKRNIPLKRYMSEQKIADLCRQEGLEDNYAAFLEIYSQIKYQDKKELLGKLSETRKSLP